MTVQVLELRTTDSPAPSTPATPAFEPVDNGSFERWRGLFLRAQRGEEAVYNQLLTELSDWLTRYYRRRLPLVAVEDATQEALLAIHAKKHSYEPDRPFGPWLAAIARYKWIDWLRQVDREKAVPLDENLGVPDHGSATRSALLVGSLIKKLKPSQATVISMVKLNGASIEEASQATGQSPSLVKVNIHRGLKRMGSYMGVDHAPPMGPRVRETAVIALRG